MQLEWGEKNLFWTDVPLNAQGQCLWDQSLNLFFITFNDIMTNFDLKKKSTSNDWSFNIQFKVVLTIDKDLAANMHFGITLKLRRWQLGRERYLWLIKASVQPRTPFVMQVPLCATLNVIFSSFVWIEPGYPAVYPVISFVLFESQLLYALRAFGVQDRSNP